MAEKKVNLKESLARLDTIVSWFGAQQDVDVEAGLEKVREGANLVKECKARLVEIKNEFEQIQRDAETSEPAKPVRKAKSEVVDVPEYESNDGEINIDNIPF